MKVLFIAIDSLRADAPGFAGGAPTPTLDSLASAGARYERLFVSGAWTIPSLCSMTTGLWPHHLGIAKWRHPYPAGVPNLFTAFDAAGFQVDVFVPHPEWGLLTVPGATRKGSSQEPDRVVSALRETRGDQLVFVHHWWTHLPYMNRAMGAEAWFTACEYQIQSVRKYPELLSKLEARYREAVQYFSEEVLPRYIEAAGAHGEELLIVITGDHGESFGTALPAERRIESIYDFHGRWIADETIAVPFVASGRSRAGALPAGRVIDGVARGVDVAATLSELAGVPWPGPAPGEALPAVRDLRRRPEAAGRSLAAELMGEAPADPAPEVLTFTTYNAYHPRTFPSRAHELWRTIARREEGSWLIWDGLERNNESLEVPKPGALEGLEAIRGQAAEPGPELGDDQVAALDPDRSILEEQLKSLGYLD